MYEETSKEELLCILEQYQKENKLLREKLSNLKQAENESDLSLEAIILSYAVDGHPVETIIHSLSHFHGVLISADYINAVLSVTENNDRNRIYELYSDNKRYFRYATDKDVLQWFQQKRIKELGLLTEDQFREKYGDIKLPYPDSYVDERMYKAPEDRMVI